MQTNLATVFCSKNAYIFEFVIHFSFFSTVIYRNLKSFEENRQVRISVSRRQWVCGFWFVIPTTSWWRNSLETIHSTNLQRTSLSKQEMNKRSIWECVAKKNDLKLRTFARLKTTHSQCQVICLLIKLYFRPMILMLLIKVQYIISGCGDAADKIS